MAEKDANNNTTSNNFNIGNIPPVLLGDNLPGRQITNMELKKEALQNIVDDLKKENEKLLIKKKKAQDRQKEKKHHFTSILTYVTDQTSLHNSTNHDLEYQFKQIFAQNNELEDDLGNNLESKKEEFKDEVYNLKEELKKQDQKRDAINIYQQEEKQLQKEIIDLKQLLIEEIINKKRDLADLEKDKVVETNMLSQQQNMKISETKKQLLDLKKEQINTTNRLTVLQNYQLSSELDIQSKSTEALLQENTKLSQQIKKQRKELEISKEIQQELQKKSVNLLHSIKQMQKQITGQEQLNQELQQEKEEIEQPMQLDAINQGQKEQIIEEIITQIEDTENQYQQVLDDLNTIQSEQQKLQKQIERKEIKNQSLSDIISHLLQTFLSNTTSMYDNISPIIDYEFDEKQLENIRKTDPKQWKLDDKEILITYLLNKVRKIMTSQLLLQNTQNQETLHVDILPDETLQDDSQQFVPFEQYSELNSQKTQSTTQSRQKLNSNNISKLSRQSSNQSTFNLPKIKGTGYDSYNSQNNLSQNDINIKQQKLNRKYSQNKISSQRFKNLPLEISTNIVKGDIREWGQQAASIPSIPTKSMKEQKLKMLF